MKALVFKALRGALEPDDLPRPEPGPGETLVEIKAAAFNRRDYWIQQGMYPGVQFPVCIGSDGAGLADGREVVINPGLNWGESELCQSAAFRILGMPDQGTFAEAIVAPSSNVYPKPEHLTWEQAAALPLAGVTAYRALFTKCEARPEEKLLITGIGGGVALMAFVFARAIGMEVHVTSGDEQKLARAIKLGAAGTANYRKDGWRKELKKHAGGFDCIIDSAGGPGFGELAKLTRPGARICTYGGTQGKIEISPQMIFWRQIRILGSTMGSPSEFQAMLDFVQKHQIVPIVDKVYPFEEGNIALERMAASKQMGKIVLTHQPGI